MYHYLQKAQSLLKGALRVKGRIETPYHFANLLLLIIAANIPWKQIEHMCNYTLSEARGFVFEAAGPPHDPENNIPVVSQTELLILFQSRLWQFGPNKRNVPPNFWCLSLPAQALLRKIEHEIQGVTELRHGRWLGDHDLLNLREKDRVLVEMAMRAGVKRMFKEQEAHDGSGRTSIGFGKEYNKHSTKHIQEAMNQTREYWEGRGEGMEEVDWKAYEGRVRAPRYDSQKVGGSAPQNVSYMGPYDVVWKN